MNRIRKALHSIQAEEQLKRDTMASLRDQVYIKQALSQQGSMQQSIPRQRRASNRRLVAAFASILLVLVASLTSFKLVFTETAYIDIEVNPSIELRINRFNQVIGVYAYNEDGQIVLDSVDVLFKPYDDAFAIIVEKVIELGYVQDQSLFSVTIQTDDSDETSMLDTLGSRLRSVLQVHEQSVEQEVFTVDANTRTCAQQQNLTPAKYLAIIELQEVDGSATFDNCRDQSVNQIRQRTRKHQHDNEPGHGHGSGRKGNLGGSGSGGAGDGDDSSN